jgi:hypothetical protein
VIGTVWESPSANLIFVVVKKRLQLNDVWECLILWSEHTPEFVGGLHPLSGSGMKQRFARIA